jgi:prepilin-type N-terminal cleavage/methylation domain-containing protein
MRTHHHRHAFSLIELAVVVAITGILAIAALPAFRTLDDARRAAAAAEVERQVLNTRAAAMSLGQSVGLRVDPSNGTFQRYIIPRGGGTPERFTSPLGTPEEALILGVQFPGAAIVGVTGGDGFTGTSTLWFGHDGTPELRAGNGTRLGGFTQDASIRLTDGYRIDVTRISGRISR